MKRRERGFSLVEILVVMVVMGIVVMAIYALYTNTQRTANTSEEVVEVQQNLRFALDQISRDIRMAGFLIPSATAPVAAAQENKITLNTALTTGRLARIAEASWSPADPTADYIVTVASSEMVDLFTDGDHVRLLRPGYSSPPLDLVFSVTGTNRADRTLALRGFYETQNYLPGDVIVFVADPNTDDDDDPNTNPPAALNQVTYRLIEDPASSDPAMRLLLRETLTDEPAQIAGKITGLQLGYLLNDGSEVLAVATNLDRVTAVRVTLIGATDATRTGQANYSGVKIRQLESVIKIRNR